MYVFRWSLDHFLFSPFLWLHRSLRERSSPTLGGETSPLGHIGICLLGEPPQSFEWLFPSSEIYPSIFLGMDAYKPTASENQETPINHTIKNTQKHKQPYKTCSGTVLNSYKPQKSIAGLRYNLQPRHPPEVLVKCKNSVYAVVPTGYRY